MPIQDSFQAAPMPSLNRRHMLAGSASALVAAGLSTWSAGAVAQVKTLPVYAAWKNIGSTIIHSTRTIETKRSAFGTSVITPSDQLYLRNNLPIPDEAIVANRDAWSMSVEGVKLPRSITVGELREMELIKIPF